MVSFKIEVHEQACGEQLDRMKAYLIDTWCECDNPEFLVYTDDGNCPCGVYKHHVHCRNCGAITQVG